MDENPILYLLNTTFSKSELKEIEEYFFKETSEIKKWTCYSDYCFGDPNKSNDVIVDLDAGFDNFKKNRKAVH